VVVIKGMIGRIRMPGVPNPHPCPPKEGSRLIARTGGVSEFELEKELPPDHNGIVPLRASFDEERRGVNGAGSGIGGPGTAVTTII